MTAEVAVANKAAIALAADSAVTVSSLGSQKVINGANKLFRLHHDLPVAVMFYGNASLCSAPVESLIKAFRPFAVMKPVSSLDEYAEAFWRFLENDVVEFTPDLRQRDTLRLVWAHLSRLVGAVQFKIQSQQVHGGRKQPSTLANEAIREVSGETQKTTSLSNFTAREVAAALDPQRSQIQALIRQALEPFGVSDAAKSRTERWIERALTKVPEFGGYAGVVFAGYVPGALYPCLSHYRVAGFVGDRLNLASLHLSQISEDNTAALFPFAQREMVYSFMEGIDPDLEATILALVSSSLTEVQNQVLSAMTPHITSAQKSSISAALAPVPAQLTDQLRQIIANFKRETYSDPVLNALEFLPKEHLAEAAESLVNLTSFRRRVSLDPETVGGDIDVAIISPGDGFVWIKRKHYFDEALNPGYFTRFR